MLNMYVCVGVHMYHSIPEWSQEILGLSFFSQLGLAPASAPPVLVPWNKTLSWMPGLQFPTLEEWWRSNRDHQHLSLSLTPLLYLGLEHNRSDNRLTARNKSWCEEGQRVSTEEKTSWGNQCPARHENQGADVDGGKPGHCLSAHLAAWWFRLRALFISDSSRCIGACLSLYSLP